VGGAGIPVHRHEQDEILFVQEGGGTAIMGELRQPVEKGATIFIPKGVWHGVEKTASDTHLLWIVTPPGLEGVFPRVSSANLLQLNSGTRSPKNTGQHSSLEPTSAGFSFPTRL
jgi:hypothetical protein